MIKRHFYSDIHSMLAQPPNYRHPSVQALIDTYKPMYNELEPLITSYEQLKRLEQTAEIKKQLDDVRTLLDENCNVDESKFEWYNNRLGLIANWSLMSKFKDYTLRQMYAEYFNRPDLFKEYHGPDIQVFFIPRASNVNTELDLDDVLEIYRDMNPEAKQIEEEWKIAQQQSMYDHGQDRKLYLSRDGKYIFKKSNLLPYFQQWLEAEVFASTINPFLAPLEHIFTEGTMGRPILVYPHIPDPPTYDFTSVDDNISYINKIMGDGFITKYQNRPVFYEGHIFMAWSRAWRSYQGINLIVDYGEGSFINLSRFSEE